ncbi:T9SS type A sorting domain-containing protein [Aquimarina sp. AD1]|uniref:T9SS type A sorting domain-containing protein n=1 Tax=Aquimarina sp. (strain AD1) TaxID=1714848 RepID=UPI000E4B66D9|nr:T9SS C-terminal target domain-containing protein [Aquimarina sp. AD1]RKN24339.1 T9SS C-terminal target domain-containing protein [Aquimarina sp. AD1]
MTILSIKIRIFTAEGKLVKSESLKSGKSIGLNDLSSGLYLIELISGTSRHTMKISKN